MPHGVSRERMDNYQNKHLRQIEHAAKQWEGRQSKVRNNELRRTWLERQTDANYRNEYDRIMGDLSHRRAPLKTQGRQEKRKVELDKLFSSGYI